MPPAIDYMKGIGWEAMETHEHALLDRMLAGMRAMPWLTVYGEPVAEGRYGVVSFNVNDVHPHDVATILDAGRRGRGRAGHHCAQPRWSSWASAAAAAPAWRSTTHPRTWTPCWKILKMSER